MHPLQSATPRASLLALALAALLHPPLALAQAAPSPTPDPPPRKDATTLTTVTVHGLQPTSLPSHVPTTIEGITGADMRERINVTDAEDALKYFPSLLVRKRYIGDYDHAVLATRASGTGNSARSLVYADGILLSNLLGNGATFAPRWGMVDPTQVERVDVLYGPFSAAYPGNSVGAVVDFRTRMPERTELHARIGYAVEDFNLYGTHGRFPATSGALSFGTRHGAFSAWLSADRSDSQGHPIAYATLTGANATTSAGTPVTGAIAGSNPTGRPWWLVGASGATHTIQDTATLKLAYDLGPDTRLSYLLGQWHNDATRDAGSYLRDAAGQAVYAGNVAIAGQSYALAPLAMPLQAADMTHRMQGLSLRREARQGLDYAIALSRYDYATDRIRSPLGALPASREGGPGRVADSHGTGWTEASVRGTWKAGTHVLEFGASDNQARLRTEVRTVADWRHDTDGTRYSAFGGRTRLQGAFVQDTWRMDPRWTTMLGLRGEHWQARDGALSNARTTLPFARRSQWALSPKAALEFAPSGDWALKASVGRAVRFPTVSELYQGSISADAIVNTDPNLRAERSVTSELSWLRDTRFGDVRATAFFERTRDALYSQTDITVVPSVTRIRNVGLIATRGVELATHLADVREHAIDVDASVTWTDSIIRRNPAFPASEGQRQPRVPRWRANLLTTWHASDHWTLTGALRYSGRQFNTLDNSDTHSHAYTGTSPFLVADARVHYRHDAHWSGAFGVDNIGNTTYWNYHPYNQRTWTLEVAYDL